MMDAASHSISRLYILLGDDSGLRLAVDSGFLTSRDYIGVPLNDRYVVSASQRVLKTGEIMVLGPHRQADGFFILGFAPIWDQGAHRVLAVLGTEVKAEPYLYDIARYRLLPISVTLLCFVFLAFVLAYRHSHLMAAVQEEEKRLVLQRYADLVSNSPAGIYRNTPGPEGRFLDANQALIEMFEASSREEFLAVPVNRFYRDPSRRRQFSDKMEKQGLVKNEEVEMVTLRGRAFWVSISATRRIDADGQTYYEGIVEDITARKSADEVRQRLAAIVESSDDAIIGADMNGILMNWNSGAERLYGYTAAEAIGESLGLIVPTDRREDLTQIFEKASRGERVSHFETVRLAKNGQRIDVSVSMFPIRAIDGTFSGVAMIARDIRDRKRLEDTLRTLSLTDDLTGLYNRRGLFTLGEQSLKLAQRIKKRIVLAYVDLDGMKWINDRFGHPKGDLALLALANVLRASFRKSDIIARIGGDEFVVMALETGNESPEKILERIAGNLAVLNEKNAPDTPLSISAGISVADPNDPCPLDELLARADRLMYEDKARKKH